MKDRWVWIDCEMTGLDPEHDRIIEIGCIITDFNLNILAESPSIAVFQSSSVLDTMDEWNTTHHNSSGLINEVNSSLYNEEKAEEEILAFISKYSAMKSSPMCGSSICQDRRFICKYMPKLGNYFHYRNLDVSSIKILANAWVNNTNFITKKHTSHRVIDDIRDSINELKAYRDGWLLK